ncbi:receptor kinase-like protein Xa21 [Pyrus x bretschneideri]|uniref:receptor kinase-like protein Xa21 n=1 Tax=Pyrus x bretschneideri TaxID=225117 RepID=UPI0020305839|nr:receptor kinase-like protein Xa21 [Pyrus x bretschneideri]
MGLRGSIPPHLGNLSFLVQLEFRNNSFHGSIPRDVEKLKMLKEILIGHNNFTEIPNLIGSKDQVEKLYVQANALKGPVPLAVFNMSSLKILALTANYLTGSIPDDLCQHLPSIQILSLARNKLDGPLPSKLWQCKELLQFSLDSNNFRGSIPKSIGNSTQLERIGISYNNLTVLPGHLNFFWRRISHLELVRATNGFHESNLLGTGGFGSVYRGTLSNGIHVAVKVFNLQLEGAFKSFERECEMLSNIRHQNLIKIISCCSQIDFEAVILNYMPNGSLEKWLYSQNSSLNILQRLNIMIDVALALEYLHHGYSISVVHCDVKPSNILLDEDMVAHVADFGIAKLGGGDYVTHTMTLATIGYMAPEYGTEGIVSTRGDVYSFGIVLMEAFTKRKPTDEMFVEEMSLTQWVSNSLSTVVDANLLGMHQEDHDFETCNDCLSSIMRLALACAAESPEERINMLEAVSTLKKIKMKILDNAARGVRLNLPVLPVWVG